MRRIPKGSFVNAYFFLGFSVTKDLLLLLIKSQHWSIYHKHFRQGVVLVPNHLLWKWVLFQNNYIHFSHCTLGTYGALRYMKCTQLSFLRSILGLILPLFKTFFTNQKVEHELHQALNINDKGLQNSLSSDISANLIIQSQSRASVHHKKETMHKYDDHFVTRNKNSRRVRITCKEPEGMYHQQQIYPSNSHFLKGFKWAYFISFPPNALKERKVCTNVQCTLLERVSSTTRTLEINATFLPFFAQVWSLFSKIYFDIFKKILGCLTSFLVF